MEGGRRAGGAGHGDVQEGEEQIRTVLEEASRKEQDPDTIWIDGSKLENGGIGAGVAWYEEVAASKQGGFQYGRAEAEGRGEHLPG